MGIIQCWLLLLGLFSVRVQADGAKENLARRGTAAQSSVFGDLLAHRAIDGGKDISVNSASCAATYLEARPWWRLDLKASYRVSIVVVTYREDCCPDNRKDFEIRFGSSLLNNGNANPSCAAISSDSVANSVTYSCSERKGQYVNVLLNGFFKALLLCEVEVYESDYFTRSFMKIAFDSTADLTDPSVTDNVLKELKSALALRGITNVTLSWSQTPEKVVIQNQHEMIPAEADFWRISEEPS